MKATGPCSIAGCDKPRGDSKGWCRMHYSRWKRHGDPLVTKRVWRDYAAELEAGEKTCTWCFETKSLDEFGYRKDRGNRPKSHCRACSAEIMKLPSSQAAARESRYRKHYGITVAQFDALLASQGSRCPICSSQLDEKTWHVDHNHSTGQVREILCSLCNKGLGQFKDDPDRLEAAAAYLRRHRAPASVVA